jgi:CelD/BcsL family acetyltransferase involved in cellulose biosynthesis
MLKQPSQDLRYVAAGESAPGLRAAWTDLTTRSADAAPSSGPDLVMPFLGKAHIASVYAQDQLLLAMPLQRGLLTDQSHHSPITDCSTCHADRLFGQTAMSLLLSKRGRPIMLKSVPVHSQFFGMLESGAAHFAVLQNWKRASLKLAGSYEAWLEQNFDTKRRKEFKRLRNRLGEQGALQNLNLDMKEDARPFIAAFLELEAKGWKGNRGTALANNSQTSAATHEALEALHKASKLRFWTMTLDGKTIASLFAYVDGNKASLGKIAYDEAFAKFSPGVLLILNATEDLFNEGIIAEVDSSAIPDHPMINRLWRHRIAMADIIVAPASVSALRFKATVWTEKMRRTLRAALKHSYHYFGRKGRS